jgi:hypothetical protein
MAEWEGVEGTRGRSGKSGGMGDGAIDGGRALVATAEEKKTDLQRL